MNERTVAIAHEIVRADVPCSLQGLAQKHGVSQRTIRNDLKTLNRFLAEHDFEGLELGQGGAIVVPADFGRALASLPSQGFYSYKMSSDERKLLAAVILAEAPGYVTLADIADRFEVSRATIVNDLDGIKETIRDAGLEVVSRPNRGLIVSGNEADRRGFLLSFALESPSLASQWYALPEFSERREDLVTIGKILGEQGRLHQAVLDDRTFHTIESYLAIAIHRCRGGSAMPPDSAAAGGVIDPDSDMVSFARDVLGLLSQYLGVNMGEGEVAHLALVLESSGYRSDAEFSIEDVQVQSVTRRFVRDVSRSIGVDLNGDYTLFEYLSNHLETMFSSGALRFPVNPSLREVVMDQPRVLDAVKDNLSILEAYSRRRITEVETIYVALHICAALERRKNTERRLRVIVVCDEGQGTSQLVVEELKGRFDIRVVKIIPAHEASYLGSYKVDLVISTVQLKDCPTEHIFVPLPFTDRDYAKMRAKIDEVRNKGGGLGDDSDELGAQELLDRIEPIIEREVPHGNENLVRSIRTEVRRYFHEAQHLEEEIVAPHLHQLLPACHVQLDVECEDWCDAIVKSALPLEEMGYIEHRYIDAMIANVEEHGPYIVLAPHFAIPHESPEKGALRVGMNLIRLAHPVEFGLEGHDPVEFVCTLSATDHKTHLKALFNLLSMLTEADGSFAQSIRSARTPEEVAAAIEYAEYQLIN